MSRPRSTNILLADIVARGERISTYVSGMDIATFKEDTLTQDAVTRCLEVVGEATGQILKAAADYQERHPGLALAEAYRARNRTAHGYGSIDIETIWRSATVDCPRLVAEARKILE